MTKEEQDSATIDTTITAGGSESLEVDTSRASSVIVLIDSGTADATPPEYKMTQRIYENEYDEHLFYDEVTAETARSWLDSAWGEKMQFEFENTSGADERYRITITSYRNMN
jgi:hypothetical protein